MKEDPIARAVPSHPGLLWSSVALLLGGVLFYVLSVSGLFWEKASSPTDLGTYAVSIILVAFGAAVLLLRYARLHPEPREGP